VVVAIGVSFGGNARIRHQSARDFGPRLSLLVAGFRNQWHHGRKPNLVGPRGGPLLGGVLGAAVYDFGIRAVLLGAS